MNTQPAQENPKVQLPSASKLRTNVELRKQIAIVCSAILAISFFFPWFQLLFVKVSGLMLGNEPGLQKIVWLMPILALITFIAALSGTKLQGLGQIAGAVPFVFLGYALYENGGGFLQIILPGGWAALVSGAALFALAPKD